jgi:hypothetical protein
MHWTKIGVLLVAGILPVQSWAVDCTPANIELSSQADVDNFQANHGPCDRVTGLLTIDGAEIENVNGLSSLTSVGDGLRFLFATSLNNVDGLSSLSSINGYLFFTDSDSLTQVDGLTNLVTVGGGVHFAFNDALTNLNGLSALDTAGSLILEFNTALQNVDGLSSLTDVELDVRLESNTALANVQGLSALTSVGRSLTVKDIQGLADLEGLQGIPSLGGDLLIRYNHNLISVDLTNLVRVDGNVSIQNNDGLSLLDGLSGLISVGNNLLVAENPELDQCTGLVPLLDRIDDGEPGPGPGASGIPDVGNEVILCNNLPGCNSLDETLKPIFKDGFEDPFTIGGAVSGLSGSGLVLRNNGGDDLAICADGSFIFANALTDGSDYAVTVLTQPTDLSGICSVSNGSGTVAGADVTDVEVTCVTDTFTVGGTVSGLSGSGLVLQNNGGDDLAIVADGSFTFATPLEDGSAYGVTVLTQPNIPSQSSPPCKVSNGSASVEGADVTNVAVTCVTEPFPIILLDENGHTSSISIGADSIPVIAYNDPSGQALKVAICTSALCTAASSAVVDDLNDAVWWPSMATGDDGFPVISYQGSGRLKVAKCNDAACSGGDEAITIVDDESNVQYTSIAIGDDGFPVISYRGSGKLKVAKCNDEACSGGDETITTINDTDEATGIHTSIAIGADGFPVISYQESSGPGSSTVRVAKCNDAACAGEDETISIIDSTGITMFESTAIAIGTDDLPVVAYFDSSGSAITVAKCNDSACAGEDETIGIVDTLQAAQTLSLNIGDDGLPILSYAALRVAKCNDAACSGGDEAIRVLENFRDSGVTSMTIGVDGKPVISYVAGGLKVVRCGTSSCQ